VTPARSLALCPLIIRFGKIGAAAGRSVVPEKTGHDASASRRWKLFFAESSLVWELGWWCLLCSTSRQMVIEGGLSYKEE